MSDWLFSPLKKLHYNLILADPPWLFEVYSENGIAKGPQAQYGCMDLRAIKELPVARLAAADCVLFMWATWPLLPAAVEVVRAWGFSYVTGGAWEKLGARGNTVNGTGYWFRSSCEPFILATLGEPRLPSRAESNLIKGLRREHSRKPEESYALLERYFPDARRAELFARQPRPGWDVWGDETDKFAEERP